MFNHQLYSFLEKIGLIFSGSLAIGATQLVYDGSPFYPQKDILVKFVAEHKYVHSFFAVNPQGDFVGHESQISRRATSKRDCSKYTRCGS
jgi:hypothetical protein